MGNKMLIDAAHPEETRVVVVRGNRVEEFDFESQARKQLRGSIFLAKVIRVEPSLQAAFVDYGGNRHGFLAFAEIHPDYYRLPQAELQEGRSARQDQQAKREQAEAPHESASTDGAHDEQPRQDSPEPERSDAADAQNETAEGVHDGADSHPPRSIALSSERTEIVSETIEAASGHRAASSENSSSETSHSVTEYKSRANDDDGDDDADDDDDGLSVKEDSEQGMVESVGGEDALEELPQRDRTRRRSYKIQEVIKRNQILLVQVVKEERGTKGAALTTFLSLAGRYTVLMPNTASGGGISRKISVVTDRKRLREIATELEVPQGMGLIIRTAGAARTKAEIKRDFEYLLRLWENVRDLTLKSKAPTLVYEEGDLIKRSIRDLYNREIDEILVAGDDAYREAKDFMRMLMPSHAKNVQPYKEPEPIFTKHGVEGQLNMMFNPRVTLKSGGYIVINQTEALVAVDVNSGKSTREHSIEETALKTNVEAADEVARQLRLRDLAGLIVIDFIDMEERRNNRTVEKKLKDCLNNDRARIQVGRISAFGLLEMSRQRLRTGMVEGSTQPCPHCLGTGAVRSTESVALMVLRAIEDMLIAKGPANLAACTSVEVALYILNNKRSYLRDIETRYGVTISVSASATLFNASHTIEKVAPAAPREGPAPKIVQMTWAHHGDADAVDDAADDEDNGADAEASPKAADDSEEQQSRRRRRRKRGGRGEADFAPSSEPRGERQERQRVDGDAPGLSAEVSGEDTRQPMHRTNGQAASFGVGEGGEGEGGEEQRHSRRSRRRGRRGGNRNRAILADAPAQPEVSGQMDDPAASQRIKITQSEPETPLALTAERAPEPAASKTPDAEAVAAKQEEARETPKPRENRAAAARRAGQEAEAKAAETPTNGHSHASGGAESGEVSYPTNDNPPPPEPVEQPRRTGPARGGWWQRRIGG